MPVTQAANPGSVPLFHKKVKFRNAKWLVCGCHTKGVKDTDVLLNGLLAPLLALLLTLQHLLLSGRVETSQQDISLSDLRI